MNFSSYPPYFWDRWHDQTQTNQPFVPTLEVFDHGEKWGRSLHTASTEPFLWSWNFQVFSLQRGRFEVEAEFHGGSGDPLGRSKFRPSLVCMDSVLSKLASRATLLCVKFWPYLYDTPKPSWLTNERKNSWKFFSMIWKIVEKHSPTFEKISRK